MEKTKENKMDSVDIEIKVEEAQRIVTEYLKTTIEICVTNALEDENDLQEYDWHRIAKYLSSEIVEQKSHWKL